VPLTKLSEEVPPSIYLYHHMYYRHQWTLYSIPSLIPMSHLQLYHAILSRNFIARQDCSMQLCMSHNATLSHKQEMTNQLGQCLFMRQSCSVRWWSCVIKSQVWHRSYAYSEIPRLRFRVWHRKMIVLLIKTYAYGTNTIRYIYVRPYDDDMTSLV